MHGCIYTIGTQIEVLINIVLAEGSFIICMTAAEVQFPTGFLIIMCNVDAHIAEHRYPDLEVH